MKVAIVRANILVECFAAQLLMKYGKIDEIFYTPIITEPTETMLEICKGNEVTIFGTYFTGHYDKIRQNAKKVKVVVHRGDGENSRKIPPSVDLWILELGYASSSFLRVNMIDGESVFYFKQVSAFLDNYMHGDRNTESKLFQYGCYTLSEKTVEVARILVDREKSIKEIFDRGEEKQREIDQICAACVENSKVYNFHGYMIRAISGDHYPVVQTCDILRQDVGIGLVHRHKMSEKGIRTMITLSSELDSGFDVEKIAMTYFNGGGMPSLAGASFDGALTLDEVMMM